MILYCLDACPPVRAVYLCLEALELEVERRVVNLFTNEHYAHEYLKLNPQHSVPTLIDDDGFVIWDSHAICSYLVSKYGKDDSLYPKDIKKRAIVDQRLHFDSGILYPRLRDISFPLLFLKCKETPEEKRKKILEAYELLETFLEGQDWLAGENYTIADLCCVASVSSLVGPLRIPADGYPNVQAWLQRCKEILPGYVKAQEAGLASYQQIVDAELE